ncbi:hypothetical protein HETIRDRAFT_451179 [Heterobasidion irregulare TC 32-1]|uniref:Uncharacterized protein n=1 Tax=Heterobasidion irregulare (strain TC 32-1) TaxID=747525 RepID=W4K6K3_HETIT|nr:uncharacterized protein HETIRDRAFT_451179 [Heterobasidion irregulare TC 32-1]ETW81369.1 hypothetical protein HETIRDRAFT_451179 [Heterobasidion irregulare TC 32-1]
MLTSGDTPDTAGWPRRPERFPPMPTTSALRYRADAPPRVSHDGLEPAAPAKDLAKLSPYASQASTARTAPRAAPRRDIAESFIACAYWVVQVP